MPKRVDIRDVKPYELPESLTQTQGPATGVVVLSHSVLWAPGGGRVDLDEPGGTGLAYAAVISEDTAEDQIAVLNRDRLLEVWDDLLLPRRARAIWEARFPS